MTFLIRYFAYVYIFILFTFRLLSSVHVFAAVVILSICQNPTVFVFKIQLRIKIFMVHVVVSRIRHAGSTTSLFITDGGNEANSSTRKDPSACHSNCQRTE